MTPADRSGIWSAMGGRWLAHPSIFLAMLPLWFVISLLTSPELFSLPRLTAHALANAGALAACTLVFYLLRATLLRGREVAPIRLSIVLLSGAVIGATKGAVTAVLLALMVTELDLATLLAARLVPATVSGMWLLPVGALVLAVREQYRIERAVLIAESVRHDDESTARDQGLDARGLPPHVRVALASFITETRQRLTESDVDLRALSTAVTESIHESLRPVSHEIWSRESRQYTDFSLRDLVRTTLVDRRFPTIAIVVCTAIGCLPLMISLSGAAEGSARVALFITLIAAALELAKRIPTTTVIGGAATLASVITLVVVVNELVARSLFGPLSGSAPITLTLAAAVTLAINTLLFGIIRGATDGRARVRSRLAAVMSEQRLSDALVSTRAQLTNRDFAQYLHGQVQNTLLAAALRLDSPADAASSPEQVILFELDALERILEGVTSGRPHSEGGANAAVGDLLAIATEPWRGLIETTITVTPAGLHVDSDLSQAAAAVVGEAVANARRHGQATAAEISVSGADQGGLHLICRDNGVGPRAGRAGLGSALYDSVAGSQWSLDLGPWGVGAQLEVTLTPRLSSS